MRKMINIFVLLLFITNSLYAGTPTQQQEADKFKKYYNHLFKYYNKSKYAFSDLSDEKKLFSDLQALWDLNKAFAELQNSTDLPLVVSKDSRDFFNDIDKNVKEEYPDSMHKELEKIMFKKSNKWSGLSNADIADLFLTAALTGPKVGLDIASGGLAETGKLLRKSKKLKKIIKIGRKWTKVKVLSVKNFKKVATALERTSRHIKKIPRMSKLSKKAVVFFDSKTFKILEYLMKQAIESEKTNVSISDDEQKKIIKQYIKDNQDNQDDAIVQFFIQFTGNSFKLPVDLLGKSIGAKYIDLFTTGVLTIYSDTESTNLFLSLLTDLGLKAAEFTPIVGPFVELSNKMIELQKKFSDGYHQAEANYINFSIQRDKLNEFYLNMYKAMVIEDTLKSIYSNNTITYDTTNIDENFGVRMTINNVYNSIYEYNSNKTVSKDIFRKYVRCLGGYLKKKDNTFEEEINNGKGIAYCLSDKKIFTADLDISTRIKERHIQLYIKLTNKLLYKIPNINGFSDVHEGEFYYPYVSFLAYKQIVSSKNDNFRPNDNITQYEAIKMTENTFFKDEFNKYKKNHSNKKVEENRFDFLVENITEINNLSFSKMNNDITRGEVAELIMQLITKKLTSKTIFNVSTPPNRKLQFYIGYKYRSLINYTDGWNLFSAGLKATGISDGYRKNDGSYEYRPTKLIKRGELSKILIKAYQFVKKEGGN